MPFLNEGRAKKPPYDPSRALDLEDLKWARLQTPSRGSDDQVVAFFSRS